MKLNRGSLRKLIGKEVVAVHKNGQTIQGKLVRIKGNCIHICPKKKKGKAYTKAIIPLVLFDLLAIGTLPYGYGYPYGYGHNPYYGPYSGYGSFY